MFCVCARHACVKNTDMVNSDRFNVCQTQIELTSGETSIVWRGLFAHVQWMYRYIRAQISVPVIGCCPLILDQLHVKSTHTTHRFSNKSVISVAQVMKCYLLVSLSPLTVDWAHTLYWKQLLSLYSRMLLGHTDVIGAVRGLSRDLWVVWRLHCMWD